MRRRRHFAVNDLSPEGQVVVRRGLEENWTLEKTVAELGIATGENIALSSLQRYWSEQRILQRVAQAQEGADAFLAMVRSNPDGRGARAVSLVLQNALFERLSELGDGKAVEEMLELWRSMEKLSLEHARVLIAERGAGAEEKKAEAAMVAAGAAAKIAEARLEGLRQKAEEIAKTVETAKRGAGSKDGRVPVEVIDTVLNDIYGLAKRAAPSPEEAPHG